MTKHLYFSLYLSLIFTIHVGILHAQSTEFIYQGQLQNSSAQANGTFDFEFALFGTSLGGSQIGATVTRGNVTVINGIFSVHLDFGSQFDGSGRFLEIRVRQSGGGSFNVLSPRQTVSSSPYSIRSLDAQNAVNAQTAANATNAVNATNATNFSGPLAGDVTGTQGTTTVARLRGTNVAGTAPTNGQVLKFNSASNQWLPGTDDTGSGGGGGTITGVTAGTGLNGGGATGNVSLAIANGGVGTTQLADGAVTDAKVNGISGSKVIGTITTATIPGANVTGAVANATNAANSAQLGGVTANQYVLTTDPRMTDQRNPASGSSSYIQNQNGGAQASSNFNISGTGNANVFNAASQFNLAGSRILGVGGTKNTFGGTNAGSNANNLAENNTFFGNSAGQNMITAGGNSFFGAEAGQNTTASANTFIGSQSGKANTGGTSNSFLGQNAGDSNTTGDNNSFFGRSAGSANQTGSGNSFFGYQAGLSSNVSNNSFFGFMAGRLTTGINNSFFGWSSGPANTSGTNNSFYGVQSGLNNTTGIDNVAFGRDAGRDNIAGSGNAAFGRNAGLINRGDSNTFIGTNSGSANFAGNNNTTIGANANVTSASLDFATAIGAGAGVSTDNTVVLGRTADTVLVRGDFQAGSTLQTFRDNSGGRFVKFSSARNVFYEFISTPSSNSVCYALDPVYTDLYYFGRCSSSIKYKKNVKDMNAGLSTIRGLRPVSYDWIANGESAIGLIAEEVADTAPMLSVRGRDGAIESVNYNSLSVVLVNAVKEQQTQIEAQKNLIDAQIALNKRQQAAVDALSRQVAVLRSLVCKRSRRSAACRAAK